MYKTFTDTVFVGKKIIYLPSCQSTNDIASDYIQQGKAQDGMIVVTSEQTAGRGQRGNTWEAEADQNLTFSVILQPHFLFANEQFQLNLAISLGIAEFIQELANQHVAIKWPNDIYCNDKKLGGILIENFLKSNRIGHSIIGIGLNINQKQFNHPKAISLAQLTNKQYELTTLLELIAVKLEKYYLILRNKGGNSLKQRYLNNLYWYQEEHLFEDLRQASGRYNQFKGQILGISNYGQLIVERQGKLEQFNFQEIKFLT